jgi:hypothetical protein
MMIEILLYEKPTKSTGMLIARLEKCGAEVRLASNYQEAQLVLELAPITICVITNDDPERDVLKLLQLIQKRAAIHPKEFPKVLVLTRIGDAPTTILKFRHMGAQFAIRRLPRQVLQTFATLCREVCCANVFPALHIAEENFRAIVVTLIGPLGPVRLEYGETLREIVWFVANHRNCSSEEIAGHIGRQARFVKVYWKRIIEGCERKRRKAGITKEAKRIFVCEKRLGCWIYHIEAWPYSLFPSISKGRIS